MKTITFTLFAIFFGLQNSALAQGYEYFEDLAIEHESAAQELPSNWGLSPDENPTVIAPANLRARGNPPSSWGVSDIITDGKMVPRISRQLRHVGVARPVKITWYNPSINDSMEGGKSTRYGGGETVNAIEDAIKNGRPVTIAADYENAFGETCNQRDRRCTVLIRLKGFNIAYPSYRKKFPYLPRNTFIAIVEDTGSAFVGSNGAKFDIASRSKKLYKASTPSLSKVATWSRLVSPCGSDEGSRYCNLSNDHISGEAMTAMGLTGRDL